MSNNADLKAEGPYKQYAQTINAHIAGIDVPVNLKTSIKGIHFVPSANGDSLHVSKSFKTIGATSLRTTLSFDQHGNHFDTSLGSGLITNK